MSEPDEKPTLWQVIKSVFGAFYGVQSEDVHKRDFSKGNPWAYIVVGLVFTVLFVLTIAGVVKWVLAGVGKGG